MRVSKKRREERRLRHVNWLEYKEIHDSFIFMNPKRFITRKITFEKCIFFFASIIMLRRRTQFLLAVCTALAY